MATVIFSNMGDTDTAVLKYIWMGMPKVKVVEITHSTHNAKALVNAAIEAEHDTLIMCGHGTPSGLLNPSYQGGSYLIDQSNYRKIKCNRVIAVWCHAKDFAETYGVKGFWSSMFISNAGEASMNSIHSVSGKSITEQEILFCIRLNELIRNYVPMRTWIEKLKAQADYTNAVVKFNYDGLRYYKVAPTPRPRPYNYQAIIDSESARWGTDLSIDDDGIDYVNMEDDGFDADSFRLEVHGSGSKTSVPYTPKGAGGIRKTSFKDAKVIKTRSKRKLKKSGKRSRITTAQEDYLDDLDAEYPTQFWGHTD